MTAIYIVEAIGTLCGNTVYQRFAIGKPVPINRGFMKEICKQELLKTGKFDCIWKIHIRFSLRFTFYKHCMKWKFNRLLKEVDSW